MQIVTAKQKCMFLKTCCAAAGLVAVIFVVASCALTNDSSGGNGKSSGPPPLVYSQENTGANYPAPPLPDQAHATVIEPFPDPFAWAADPLGKTRSTRFSDWEHHRSEIAAQIQNYEIGTKMAVDPKDVTAS